MGRRAPRRASAGQRAATAALATGRAGPAGLMPAFQRSFEAASSSPKLSQPGRALLADISVLTDRARVRGGLLCQQLDGATGRRCGEEAGCTQKAVVRGPRAVLRFAALLPTHIDAHRTCGLVGCGAFVSRNSSE